MDNILIVGSSGHAKVVIDIVLKRGDYQISGLIDRFRGIGEQTSGYSILGGEEDLPRLVREHSIDGVIVAIGDNFVRGAVASRVRELCPDLPFPTAIHPMATVATEASVGEGSVIMPGACIGPCCSVGRFCILNTNSSLDHDSTIKDHASLGPAAATGGNCTIGEYTAVGIGAHLLHGIVVDEHSVIGASSLVTRSLGSLVVAYGRPARVIRTRRPGESYL